MFFLLAAHLYNNLMNQLIIFFLHTLLIIFYDNVLFFYYSDTTGNLDTKRGTKKDLLKVISVSMINMENFKWSITIPIHMKVSMQRATLANFNHQQKLSLDQVF